MYSKDDFAKLWFIYRTKGGSKGISIKISNVPYKVFNK